MPFNNHISQYGILALIHTIAPEWLRWHFSFVRIQLHWHLSKITIGKLYLIITEYSFWWTKNWSPYIVLLNSLSFLFDRRALNLMTVICRNKFPSKFVKSMPTDIFNFVNRGTYAIWSGFLYFRCIKEFLCIAIVLSIALSLILLSIKSFFSLLAQFYEGRRNTHALSYCDTKPLARGQLSVAARSCNVSSTGVLGLTLCHCHQPVSRSIGVIATQRHSLVRIPIWDNGPSMVEVWSSMLTASPAVPAQYQFYRSQLTCNIWLLE